MTIGKSASEDDECINHQIGVNEHHRRKRTVYHFGPLAHFVARFRSTTPFGCCASWTQQAAGNRLEGIEPMFRDLKSGGYHLEDTQLKGQRFLAIVLLVTMAYTLATDWGKQIHHWSDWAEQWMRLKPQKRVFFLRGLRAISLIQAIF